LSQSGLPFQLDKPPEAGRLAAAQAALMAMILPFPGPGLTTPSPLAPHHYGQAGPTEPGPSLTLPGDDKDLPQPGFQTAIDGEDGAGRDLQQTAGFHLPCRREWPGSF
jgi:hypothetical protein